MGTGGASPAKITVLDLFHAAGMQLTSPAPCDTSRHASTTDGVAGVRWRSAQPCDGFSQEGKASSRCRSSAVKWLPARNRKRRGHDGGSLGAKWFAPLIGEDQAIG